MTQDLFRVPCTSATGLSTHAAFVHRTNSEWCMSRVPMAKAPSQRCWLACVHIQVRDAVRSANAVIRGLLSGWLIL